MSFFPFKQDANNAAWVNPTGAPGSWLTYKATGTGAAPPSFTVPVGKKWRVKTIGLVYVCNATVATRQLAVLAKSGQNANAQFVAAYSPCTLTAGTSGNFYYGPSLPTSTSFTVQVATIGFPEILLQGGSGVQDSISFFPSNGQAGDTMTAYLNVEELADA